MFRRIDTYEEYLQWWPTGLLWMSAPGMGYMPMSGVEDGTPEQRREFRWEQLVGFRYAIQVEE